MARQTRAQRRARRLAHAGPEPAVAGSGGRDGGGKPPVRLAPEPPARSGQPARSAHARFGAPGNFVRESVGELRKVEWPGQNQVVQGTVVVIIACVIIGTYLYFADQVFSRFVTRVLLGQ